METLEMLERYSICKQNKDSFYGLVVFCCIFCCCFVCVCVVWGFCLGFLGFVFFFFSQVYRFNSHSDALINYKQAFDLCTEKPVWSCRAKTSTVSLAYARFNGS